MTNTSKRKVRETISTKLKQQEFWSLRRRSPRQFVRFFITNSSKVSTNATCDSAVGVPTLLKSTTNLTRQSIRHIPKVQRTDIILCAPLCCYPAHSILPGADTNRKIKTCYVWIGVSSVGRKTCLFWSSNIVRLQTIIRTLTSDQKLKVSCQRLRKKCPRRARRAWRPNELTETRCSDDLDSSCG